jgi:antitoxin ParD1/3/4
MNISLPAALRQWVEDQVETRGFGTASEFVRDMIRREREKAVRAKIDETLIEAMRSPMTEMTDKDWDDIRNEARRRARKKTRA